MHLRIKYIWGKHNFTPERFLNQADLVRNVLWRHWSTPLHEKQPNGLASVDFCYLVLSICEQLFLCFYFLINLGRLNLRLFEFKLVLYRSKMPNSENCLLYINCQKCTTLCIKIHNLCSKTRVYQSTKSFFLQNLFLYFFVNIAILSDIFFHDIINKIDNTSVYFLLKVMHVSYEE